MYRFLTDRPAWATMVAFDRIGAVAGLARKKGAAPIAPVFQGARNAA